MTGVVVMMHSLRSLTSFRILSVSLKVIALREEEHRRAWEECEKIQQHCRPKTKHGGLTDACFCSNNDTGTDVLSAGPGKRQRAVPPGPTLKRSLRSISRPTEESKIKQKTKANPSLGPRLSGRKRNINSRFNRHGMNLTKVARITHAPWSTSGDISLGKVKQDDKCYVVGHIPELEQETIFSGEKIREEIPNGLQDPILLLFRAASIRCIVPSYLPSKTVLSNLEDAYFYYDSLSPGPEKACFEKEAWDYVEPFVNQLMTRFNVVYIRQLLPHSKMTSLLQALDPSPSMELERACIKIIESLRDCLSSKSNCRGRLAKSLKGVKIQSPDDKEVISQFAALAYLNSYEERLPAQHFENCGLWGEVVLDKNEKCAETIRESLKSGNSRLRPQDDKSGLVDTNRSWVVPYASKTIRDSCVAYPVYAQFRHGAQIGIDDLPSPQEITAARMC